MPRALPSSRPNALVRAPALQALVCDCLTGLGVPRPDSLAVAEVLVDANLRGEDAHGFARLPVYMRRVREGLAGGTEGMREVVAFGAVRRLDAARALGPAVAVKATDLAADLAREHGIGLVAVGMSTHFGTAGFYARRAAAQGLMALVTTNGPANLAPHGASERFLGTNPLAIGAPLGRHGTFVLDMSSSVAARGKIIRARELGEAIAPGLALDVEGRPTQDPAAALAGAVLPAAGAKGSGLALAIALLSGILAGADFDDELAPMYGSSRPQNVGHVFIVIDPWRLGAREEVEPRLEAFVERLHGLRGAEGAEAVRFPGEGSEARARARRRDGIPLATAELDAVASLCSDAGLVEVLERVQALSIR